MEHFVLFHFTEDFKHENSWPGSGDKFTVHTYATIVLCIFFTHIYNSDCYRLRLSLNKTSTAILSQKTSGLTGKQN